MSGDQIIQFLVTDVSLDIPAMIKFLLHFENRLVGLDIVEIRISKADVTDIAQISGQNTAISK